jgi:hypothetical protein
MSHEPDAGEEGLGDNFVSAKIREKLEETKA